MATKRKAARKAARKAGGGRRKREAARATEKGKWVTKHPKSGEPLFKVVDYEGKACNGGSFAYGDGDKLTGKEFTHKGFIRMCSDGFHLTTEPAEWSGYQAHSRTFRAAYWLPEGKKEEARTTWAAEVSPDAAAIYELDGGDKMVVRRFKFLEEVVPVVVREPVLPKVTIVRGKDGIPKVSYTELKQGKLAWRKAKKGEKLLRKRGDDAYLTHPAGLAKNLEKLREELTKRSSKISDALDDIQSALYDLDAQEGESLYVDE